MSWRSKRSGPYARAPYRRTNRSTSRTWSGLRTTAIVGGFASSRSQASEPSGGPSASSTATSPPLSTHVQVTTSGQSSSGRQPGRASRQIQSPGATSWISAGIGLAAAVALDGVLQVEERAEPALTRRRDVVDPDLLRVRIDTHVRRVLLAEHEQAHGLVRAVLVPVHAALASGERAHLALPHVLPALR